jgi:hypothetical protein
MSDVLIDNATRALERYRAEERRLEEQAMAISIHLQLVKEFIAALTAAPKQSRKPRVVEAEAALNGILPEPDTAA